MQLIRPLFLTRIASAHCLLWISELSDCVELHHLCVRFSTFLVCSKQTTCHFGSSGVMQSCQNLRQGLFRELYTVHLPDHFDHFQIINIILSFPRQSVYNIDPTTQPFSCLRQASIWILKSLLFSSGRHQLITWHHHPFHHHDALYINQRLGGSLSISGLVTFVALKKLEVLGDLIKTLMKA